ncbi:family 26 glycoside hydrolase [Piromyces sp. E2]|nr:family 26 glycoside hydrolase [Piromyces sp. E2]|eukprot:OUM69137.1 family 26 glycoside hydrolase [Piromyces sp. E2]
MVVLSENGRIPDIQQCVDQNAWWGYFQTWNSEFILQDSYHTNAQLKEYFNHKVVMNMDELPSFNVNSYEYESGNNNSNNNSNNNANSTECFSVALGYPCCKENNVVYTDNDGDWGVEDNQWCGIGNTSSAASCWSEALGYPCCVSTSDVYYTDNDGNWGVENGNWLLKAWCGYKLDNTVLKAVKLVNSSFPDCCFCCKNDDCEQSLEHWLLQCSSFGEIKNDVFNNLDIVHYIFNSDSRNVKSENSGNISGNNSSEIGLSNSYNDISNNSDSVNENLSVNNLSVNNLTVNRSSINRSKRKCSKVFNFLVVDAIIIETKLNGKILMPIVSGQRWSVINRYSTKVTKSVNADNTVRQASSAIDYICAYVHATERNRNSLSGSQTQ